MDAGDTRFADLATNCAPRAWTEDAGQLARAGVERMRRRIQATLEAIPVKLIAGPTAGACTKARLNITLGELTKRGHTYESDGSAVASHQPSGATTRIASSSVPTASDLFRGGYRLPP